MYATTVVSSLGGINGLETNPQDTCLTYYKTISCAQGVGWNMATCYREPHVKKPKAANNEIFYFPRKYAHGRSLMAKLCFKKWLSPFISPVLIYGCSRYGPVFCASFQACTVLPIGPCYVCCTPPCIDLH